MNQYKIDLDLVYESAKKRINGLRKLSRSIVDEIRTDIAAVKERDPAARNSFEILLLYSGVHALLAYRVSHKLYINRHFLSARAVSQLARHFTGIEIHP